MTESSTTEPDFDRVARLYRWAEYATFGPWLQRTRTHYLPLLQGRRHAFVLGDGDGRFLSALFAANSVIEATAVDTSAAMLKLLRARCAPFAGRLRTIIGSALTACPDRNTDLIVSHFFLDCLQQEQVERLTARLGETCSAGTLWLVSDFQVPPGRSLRLPGALLIRLLYTAFRVLTGLRVRSLPDTGKALEVAGFNCLHSHSLLGGLLYTELWRLERSYNTQPAASGDHPPEYDSG